ncbi:MAG: bifunctional aspartate kinase/homoserine dehydrogenase I [Flavobacteriaceae bacterium]|nr:bifunctional aspartate kinase/homoserine dehydrogenase I [Flavobacteriaceae bacterium]|tara:strand:- start:18680 stop:21139 length:2460 start_codon:yes stop_codon:yes gene_type:complete
MKVLKFGGSSIADSKSISNVIEIVKDNTDELCVVVSAIGNVTDLLLNCLKFAKSQKKNDYKSLLLEIEKINLEPIKKCIPLEYQSKSISFIKKHLNEIESLLDSISLWKEITNKNLSTVSGYGEIMSSYIINEIFNHNGIISQHMDSRLFIKTKLEDEVQILDNELTGKKIHEHFKSKTERIAVIPGFISSDNNNEITTLGRGGSDYSASIIADHLNGDVLEIWTDVSGMYTANPQIVKQAIPITKISYYEAMELSYFGAKVIYPPSIQPLINKKIPLLIKNTFNPKHLGTKISEESSSNEVVVKGISHIDDVSLINIEGSGMFGVTGFAKRMFEALSERKVNVIMITQASSEHSICVAVRTNYDEIAKKAIDNKFSHEISLGKIIPSRIERNMVNIAVVGEGMKNHQGISGKLFSTLGNNNINIKAIAQGATERNISIIVDKKNLNKAINSLHEKFFESQIKQLNLFIIGVGNVGGKLLEQIKMQENYLSEFLGLKIRVLGLSNSRKMILSKNPIKLSNWEKKLDQSNDSADKEAFFNHAIKLNLRNSIFVDNTANESIAKEYLKYLKNSIGVVTCNKIAASDVLDNYLNLKNISRKYGSSFLFETNVGAGLPIIDTLNNLVASGDQILEIQAVLSGSLNFIFNNFKKGASFYEVTKTAQKNGYTEPDPKIDLKGIDVARKILILARESGIRLEFDEIENKSFLPKDCLDTTDNESFFSSLKENDSYFNKLLNNAEKNNSKLKYVATLKNGKASVGLKEISKDHDFYNLKGSDNIVLFYTNRYKNQPLIVKGAGAGGEVTASGIFADIIRMGKSDGRD